MGAYAVGVAQAASPLGPFTKLPAPILHTNTTPAQPPFVGPGHCSVLGVQDGSGGTAILYHAWQWAPSINFGEPRYMMLDAVQWVPATDGSGLVWPQLTASGGVPSNRTMPVP
jgi:arabinan endo-1,5-alpha-L-arabinosidase